MTDDDAIQQQVQRMLDAQATHRDMMKAVGLVLAKVTSDLWLANQALEMSREAGMAVLTLLETKRAAKAAAEKETAR